MKVAILGGGVTGVTLAALIEARGADVTLYEAAPKLGGLCGSETVEGYVADRAGGHIIYSRDPLVLSFILGALGEGRAVRSERNTRIYHGGHLIAYPFENGLGDLPKAENFHCLKGYVDAYVARKNGQAREPDNFHDWCLWRFGEGICRLFMHPYNEKIWKFDLSEMGTAWVRGRVPDAPVDDVLKAAIGIPTVGYAHQSTFYYPLEGGFESIVTGIAGRIRRATILLGTPVVEVEKRRGTFRVNGSDYDLVVSTLPLEILSRALAGIPADVAECVGQLRYRSLASVLVALARPPRHAGISWVYFAKEEDGPFNRITFLSHYSPRNVPTGKGSILAEITHGGGLVVGEDLERRVARHLVSTGMCGADEILFTRSFDNRYAYIVFDRDHERNVGIVRSYLKSIGLPVAGRFGNYNYYNSDQCIREALDLAASLPLPQ